MEKIENEVTKKDKITIHQIIWYLLIFSILGLIVETLFCYATTGRIESRKGLIYGPFCPIYGVGATAIIIMLNKFKNSKLKLFIYGGLAGSGIEYIVSYMLEAFYGTRFWNYSHINFNLNGRICILYTFYWAILAFILVKFVKPFIDKKIISKLNFKILDITIVILAIIDSILTVWGINTYRNRAINKYYNKYITNNNVISTFENKVFSDEKMKETFPNMRFINENGKEIWIRDL